MSIDAFLDDPESAQLQIASDPGLMCEVFRRHLRPITSPAYEIQECTIYRVRCYRGADRGVLQYTLRLVQLVTGRERSQRVSGLVYAESNLAARIYRTLDAATSRTVLDETLSPFEPYSFIPELQMLVQVFPYDWRLPSLPLLMTRPSPELERQLLADFGVGHWEVAAYTIEPIRYRASLGAALRYTLQGRDITTGSQEQRRFYVKVYPEIEEAAYSNEVLQILYTQASAGGDRFRIGRPIAFLKDHNAVFQEEVFGVSLQEIFLKGSDATNLMRQAARAVAAFHLDSVAVARQHGAAEEVKALERAKNLLQWSCPSLSAEVDAIIRTVIAGLNEVPLRPTHRDLRLDHILCDDGGLGLVDLDDFAAADPVLDVANLLAHLAGLSLRSKVPRERMETHATAFADEYFAQVPSSWRDRLPLHYAGALMKVAPGYFRRQKSGWREKIAVFLQEAKANLTD